VKEKIDKSIFCCQMKLFSSQTIVFELVFEAFTFLALVIDIDVFERTKHLS